VDDCGELCGIFTDGDLRRLMEKRGTSALDLLIGETMTRNPRTISPKRLASEAVRVMERCKISVLIAVDDNKPIGIIHLHELLKAGVS
jgi:arabinose-5-phosphate isomerase